MSDNSMTISNKTIIWILLLAMFTVVLVVVFNGIDNRKKFNKYEAIYTSIQSSDYIERFGSLIQDFSITDTSSIINIKENLGLLEGDYNDINYSEIYIKGDDCFYRITSNQYYKNSKLLSEINFLPKEVKQFIDYLDHSSNPSIDSLYLLSGNDSRLELMLKLDIGYLRLRHFRN